jgi:hypothetical protein
VDLVVLSVDSDREHSFCRAIDRLPEHLKRKIVPIVFEPELEMLFVQSKGPLEAAVGIPACTSHPPEITGDPKAALRAWMGSYAGGRALDSLLRQRIAECLDVGEDSQLLSVLAWQRLVDGLMRLAQRS